jgi:hypothetical protein
MGITERKSVTVYEFKPIANSHWVISQLKSFYPPEDDYEYKQDYEQLKRGGWLADRRGRILFNVEKGPVTAYKVFTGLTSIYFDFRISKESRRQPERDYFTWGYVGDDFFNIVFYQYYSEVCTFNYQKEYLGGNPKSYNEWETNIFYHTKSFYINALNEEIQAQADLACLCSSIMTCQKIYGIKNVPILEDVHEIWLRESYEFAAKLNDTCLEQLIENYRDFSESDAISIGKMVKRACNDIYSKENING